MQPPRPFAGSNHAPLVWRATEGIIACLFDYKNQAYSSMRTLTLSILTAMAAAGLAFSAPALAAGDIEEGQVKAYTCTGCHGIPGYKNVYPTYHVPKIGGQNQAYLEAALKAYREGERTHSTMQLQAESLSDEDIADISAYFASLEGE